MFVFYPGSLRKADQYGLCVCDRAFEVGDKCVAASTLLSAIILPALAVLLVGTLLYVRRAAEAHAIRTIASAELKYSEPKEVCEAIALHILMSVVSKYYPELYFCLVCNFSVKVSCFC